MGAPKTSDFENFGALTLNVPSTWIPKSHLSPQPLALTDKQTKEALSSVTDLITYQVTCWSSQANDPLMHNS